MATKKCPVCGAPVKLENLERHVKNQHPRAHVAADELLTTSERKRVQTAKAAAPRPAMTRRGKQIVAIVAFVMVVIVALLLIPRGNVGLSVGKAAPDFTSPTSDGRTVHLADLRGRPVLIEFMDVDCSHCINEAPTLATLYTTFGSNVTFLSIDANIVGAADTADRIETFKTTYHTPWAYSLFDQSVVNEYQVSATPTMYVLDRNGVVVHEAFVGETSAATLTSVLNQASR